MTFDSVYGSSAPYYSRPSTMLTDFMADMPPGLRVLDLGSGDGRNSVWMLKQGHSVSAIDLSIVGIDKLRLIAQSLGKSDQLRSVVGSAVTTTLFEHEYDVIVASTILCHLVPAEAMRVMSQMRSALAPGGHLYVSVFTREDPSFRNGISGERSETADAVINHFEQNGLLSKLSAYTILRYFEGKYKDLTHGPAHLHVVARAIARKDQR